MFRPGWTVWCENEPIKSTELARLCKQKLDWSKTTTYTVIKRLSDRGVVKNEERTFHRRTLSFKNQFAFLVWESLSNFGQPIVIQTVLLRCFLEFFHERRYVYSGDCHESSALLYRNDRTFDTVPVGPSNSQFAEPQNDTERVRLGAIIDHARHDLAARPAGKFQFFYLLF